MTGATPPGRAHPGARLAAGLGALGLAAAAAGHRDVGPVELRLFRAVNRLPDSLRGPLWVLMQGGSLGAAPATALVVWAAGHPRGARRLVVTGAATWALAKAVKVGVRRPRPTVLVRDARVRGHPQSGLGFVSGHAGVAAGLCAAAVPLLRPRGRRLAIAAASAVGVTRLYVGAHLPLDVAGGAALGVAVEAAFELWERRRP